ncbi:MAG: DNA repair protein RadA, partial [Actinomyces sp.]
MASRTTRVRTSYVCTECGWTSPKWLGQCRGCKAWGTLEELTETPGADASCANGPE